MRIGPKYKIARRLGAEVFEKTQTQKFQLRTDRKNKRAKRRRRSRSDYGAQLLEKQKVRFMYGLSERQFSRYIKESLAQKQMKSTEALYQKLESRLDNTVYKMGLANTRRFARQMVSHGHIEVSGKKIRVPSYEVKEGDVVRVRERSREKEPFQNLEEKSDGMQTPNWLSFDAKNKEGKVVSLPKAQENIGLLDLASVIEFYSR